MKYFAYGMNTNSVIVIGCSWLVGEWETSNSKSISVSHPGVSLYMQDWCKLKNLSRPRASNWSILEILMYYMDEYGHMLSDSKIIVFQTDPMRHERSKVHDVDYQRIVADADSVHSLYQSLCEIWYIKLHELAQRLNTKIYVSGALSDVDVTTIKLYENLECVCPSWIKMLYPGHTPSAVPLMIESETFELLYKFNRLDLADELISIADKNVVMFQDAIETDLFGPSYGHYHPSRQGHKILSDHLKTVFGRAVE